MDALVSPPPEADFFAFSHRKYAIYGVGWGGDTFRGLDTRVSPRGTGWPRECFVGDGRQFISARTCSHVGEFAIPIRYCKSPFHYLSSEISLQFPVNQPVSGTSNSLVGGQERGSSSRFKGCGSALLHSLPRAPVPLSTPTQETHHADEVLERGIMRKVLDFSQ